MLAHLLFIKSVGSWCTDGRYNRHYMLAYSIFYSEILWRKFMTLYVRFNNSGCLVLQIDIHWYRINCQQYMLAHTINHDISIHAYKWVIGGRNTQHSILDFHCENISLW